MTIRLKSIAILIGVIVLGACKKELEPSELITGTWTLESTEVLAQVTPGDGSSLTFNACSSSCTGSDYNGSNGTVGSFTYTLNTDGTILNISDTMNNGGGNGATWDVLELTESQLRITASTIFGNVKREYRK